MEPIEVIKVITHIESEFASWHDAKLTGIEIEDDVGGRVVIPYPYIIKTVERMLKGHLTIREEMHRED